MQNEIPYIIIFSNYAVLVNENTNMLEGKLGELQRNTGGKWISNRTKTEFLSSFLKMM